MTLLRASDVADLLDVSPSTVTALARSNAIPHVRIGRLYRFPKDAIDAWIGERTRYPDAREESKGRGDRLQQAPQGRTLVRRPRHRVGEREARSTVLLRADQA